MQQRRDAEVSDHSLTALLPGGGLVGRSAAAQVSDHSPRSQMNANVRVHLHCTGIHVKTANAPIRSVHLAN
jgi:hypothetical protein